MRILWHSNAPWCTSGYGTQTAVWAPRLAGLGHQVTISAYTGLDGKRATYKGLPVLPPVPGDRMGELSIPVHAAATRADLIITLMDAWTLDPRRLAGLPLACWLPVDCDPLGAVDEAFLKATRAAPVAMSRHGQDMLRRAGLDEPQYVPHGIDTERFRPAGDRAAARAAAGLPADLFVVGINAANLDGTRKGYPEQLSAFARFHARHPRSLMLIHARAVHDNGLDLPVLARRLGIAGAVAFSPQAELGAGRLDGAWMRRWYQCLDILSACSYGEGFGLPVIEAMACGVPVVTTSAGVMAELADRTCGWLVEGEPHWNRLHQAWWTRPAIAGITRAYEKAFAGGAERRRDGARKRALEYDEYSVTPMWEKVLCTLAAR